MATIYLSSTFKDLQECRQRVYRALARLRHTVRAMEDYVARDDRPIDACINDVAASDLYVGVFAHRYGYIADDPQRNPNKLSITELELRTAQTLGKKCLVFLLDPTASWPPVQMDQFTKEGEAGARIATLRAELETHYMTAYFKGPDDIGELVATSVTNAIGTQEEPSGEPDPRQISGDVLLIYSALDEAAAQALGTSLRGVSLRVTLSPRALFSADAASLEQLDQAARTHQRALVYLTSNSIGQMAAKPSDTLRVLSLLDARAGGVIAVAESSAAAAPPEWPLASRIPVASAAALTPAELAAVVGALEAGSPTLRSRAVVGLPFVVVAMTNGEAVHLRDFPDEVGAVLAPASFERFKELRATLEKTAAAWPSRYGRNRLAWQPLGSAASIHEVLDTIVGRLNSAASGTGTDRKLKLQYYPIDPVLSRDTLLRPIYMTMARAGCVAIVDELSLFHPAIRQEAQSFLNRQQVSVITVAPTPAVRSNIEELLEGEARRQLGEPYNRYDLDFDPGCEFGVEEERHLKRWLHRSLPDAIRQLRQPGPDRQRLAAFRTQLGASRQGYDGVLFPGGGD
jgi:hypothetical protein